MAQDYNSTLISDELLRLVTPVIPILEWKQIAYEAFNLTVNEVDAIESALTRADVIFHLLHHAVQRDQMPAKVLKQKIEDARADGINIGQKGLENIEAGDAIPSNVLLMNLSKQLGDYDSFLVGYMGCNMEEVRTSMHLNQDHKICVLKMLSLWRCKDEQDGVKTVEELLSALKDVLQRGPYKVLENLITDWWSSKAARSNVVTRNYMQTNMPVSSIEDIQSQLKDIYTNTLSTLCPLPWLEEAEDVQYNFDDVFIPLRTIDIPIQQRKVDLPGPSDKRHNKKKTGDLAGPSDSIDDEEHCCHSWICGRTPWRLLSCCHDEVTALPTNNPGDNRTTSIPQEMVDRQPQQHDEQTGNLSESSRSSADEEQIDVFAGPSCRSDDEEQIDDWSDSSGEMEPHQQTSLQRLELYDVHMTSDSARHLAHYISRGTQLKELELRNVRDSDVRMRSVLPVLLHHLSSHPLPSLHYLGVWCPGDSDVRALTTFLPHCTNLRTLDWERDWGSDVSESVEEEMWEAVVRRCRNLEEVRVRGDDSDAACDRLGSVLRKLYEREGIQALKLRRIVRVDWDGEVIDDYTEQVKHLLPVLQQ